MVSHIKEAPLRRIFVIFNYVFCIVVALVCIIPVIHVISVSFSSQNAVFSGHVTLWPVEPTLDNYQIVVRDAQFFRSYLVTIIRSAVGLLISLTLTVLAAYPMSLGKNRFSMRTFFVYFFLITMIFNGGMIPTYMVVKTVGILDTLWALVLPGAISVYNLILMMNFMKSLPESIQESAYIDGAGHWRTLCKIVLPLCKPSLATISLFIVLANWNAWFDGSIYIVSDSLKPLQTYLRSVIIVDPSISDTPAYLEDIIANVSADGTNGAKIFLALLPIICVYPFLQKYFVKGIVRGSVKE